MACRRSVCPPDVGRGVTVSRPDCASLTRTGWLTFSPLRRRRFFSLSVGDQNWRTDPNAPASLVATCVDSCLARFPLAVEKGACKDLDARLGRSNPPSLKCPSGVMRGLTLARDCFFAPSFRAVLGANGWDASYDLPLGDPLGPAVYSEADVTASSPATLTRNFSSGTYIVFTYNDKGTDGEGEIFWGGKPPAPTPPPTPPPPPPSPVPGPPIQCGGVTSSYFNETTLASDDVTPSSAATAEACCADCAGHSACVEWASHTKDAAKQPGTCHLHGPHSIIKPQTGCIAGVIKRG